MDNYTVKFYPRAARDLDGIFAYIAKALREPGTALHLITEPEDAILSLAQLPERGAPRRVGAYANGDYRQLFVKNYIILYRVKKETHEVHVVTVQYGRRNF